MARPNKSATSELDRQRLIVFQVGHVPRKVLYVGYALACHTGRGARAARGPSRRSLRSESDDAVPLVAPIHDGRKSRLGASGRQWTPAFVVGVRYGGSERYCLGACFALWL